VTSLKVGDEVLVRKQGGARHTGIEIQEFIVEKWKQNAECSCYLLPTFVLPKTIYVCMQLAHQISSEKSGGNCVKKKTCTRNQDFELPLRWSNIHLFCSRNWATPLRFSIAANKEIEEVTRASRVNFKTLTTQAPTLYAFWTRQGNLS